MRIRSPYLLAGILAFIFISCQKEASLELPRNGGSGGSSNGSEIGTWKFVGMHSITSQAVEYKFAGDAIKDVTTSDYTTENNTGTLKFDGSNCTMTGVGYGVNTIITLIEYTNGVPDSPFQAPMIVNLPPTDGTAPYKKIGSDSLYFQTGAMGTVGAGGTVQSIATGYKLRYYGADSMTMSTAYDDVQLNVTSGIPTKITSHAVIVNSLKKQ
jgi:hypothetical protein